MNRMITLVLLMITVSLFSQEEQLIIYTQENDALFIENTLPALAGFAKEESIDLYQFNADEGVPENITSTPAIIYRNGKGQSTYAGRYTSFSTIKNFVRSARVVRSAETALEKENMLVTNKGKMQIAAAIKITEIKQYNNQKISAANLEAFTQAANKGIAQALNNYNLKTKISLNKTDRIFYLDFHPYYSSDDSLILSFELYSQFSCIDPIYVSIIDKVQDSDVTKAFEKATTILNNAIDDNLENSIVGDAYSSIKVSTIQKSLTDLDIPTPLKPNDSYKNITPDRPLPKLWQFLSAINEKTPVLQFNFIEPLTRYTGEVKNINGNIQFNDTYQLTEGTFQAVMKSLTMGEDSFDKKVLKSYVKAKSNPKSTFQINSVVGNDKLEWAKSCTVTINGNMTLLKKSRPITVTAQLTPFINNQDQEVLLVQANWSMNITEDWDIQGPDGPAPAKETLQFSLNILMEPLNN